MTNATVTENTCVERDETLIKEVGTLKIGDPELLELLNDSKPEELLAWAASAHGCRAAIVTSFQDTGCAMIDMAHRIGANLRVVTVDTLRLHPETYDLIDRIEERYGIEIERFKPDPDRLRRMIEDHGEFLFFDSKLKQEHCCHIRKVEPNDRALATLDVWFTGLRRDHSQARRQADKASYVDAIDTSRPGGHVRKIVKIAPLVDWTADRVREYMKEYDVPHNALYDQGYTSIGCIICSTPTLAWEEKRAGRWRWFNEREEGAQKECGIHSGGSGI